MSYDLKTKEIYLFVVVQAQVNTVYKLITTLLKTATSSEPLTVLTTSFIILACLSFSLQVRLSSLLLESSTQVPSLLGGGEGEFIVHSSSGIMWANVGPSMFLAS